MARFNRYVDRRGSIIETLFWLELDLVKFQSCEIMQHVGDWLKFHASIQIVYICTVAYYGRMVIQRFLNP